MKQSVLVRKVTPEMHYMHAFPVSCFLPVCCYNHVWKHMYKLLCMYFIYFIHIVSPIEVEPLEPGCDVDDDCPLHKSCMNRKCIDPCIVHDPCGTNAYCRVQTHEPICTCPPGFIGDPRVECKERKSHLLSYCLLYLYCMCLLYVYKIKFSTVLFVLDISSCSF